MVVETGWSETRKQLYRDRDVWLVAGAATTEIVLIIKWSRVAGKRVKGDIEAWEHGTPGNLRLMQKEPSPLSHSVLNMSRLTLSDMSFFEASYPRGVCTVDQVTEKFPVLLKGFSSRRHCRVEYKSTPEEVEYIRAEGYKPA